VVFVASAAQRAARRQLAPQAREVLIEEDLRHAVRVRRYQPLASAVDHAKFGATVDRLRRLDITRIAGCHTPVIAGEYVDKALGHMRELPPSSRHPCRTNQCSTRSSR
jgi:hypothetical protein